VMGGDGSAISIVGTFSSWFEKPRGCTRIPTTRYLKTRTVFKYNRSKKNPLYEHAEQLIASTSHRLMRSFGQLRTTIQTRIKIAESKKNSQTDRHAFSRTDRQEYDHLPQDFCLENESLAISHSRRREGFFAFFAT